MSKYIAIRVETPSFGFVGGETAIAIVDTAYLQSTIAKIQPAVDLLKDAAGVGSAVTTVFWPEIVLSVEDFNALAQRCRELSDWEWEDQIAIPLPEDYKKLEEVEKCERVDFCKVILDTDGNVCLRLHLKYHNLEYGSGHFRPEEV